MKATLYHHIFLVLLSLIIGIAGLIAFVAVVVYFTLYPKGIKSNLTHEEKCRQLQVEFIVKKNKEDQPFCTNRSQSDSMTTRNTLQAYKTRSRLLDLDSFNEIIEINVTEKYVHVECRASIGDVVEVLTRLGYSLPVVPELRTLTIGGLLCGAGIESSSHKYGLFMNCCIMYKVLFGNGKIKEITASSDPFLFSCIPFSSGSLCMLLSAKLSIIPIKPFVLLTYRKVKSHSQAIQLLTTVCNDSNCSDDGENGEDSLDSAEFVEGILMTNDVGVVITAELQDNNISDGWNTFYSDWKSKFWYRHVQELLELFATGMDLTNCTEIFAKEYMPLVDYYFRHDRGIFWTLERKFPIVTNPIVRLLFGWALGSNIRRLSILSDRVYSDEITRERKRVVQDPIVPLLSGVEALKTFESIFDITPIWLCPFKYIPLPMESILKFPPSDQLDSQPLFYLDIGLYGVAKTPSYDPLASHRNMEKFLRKVHGFVAPYSVCYSTKEEFWSAFYNENIYYEARSAFEANGNFVDLYTKIGGGTKVNKL